MKEWLNGGCIPDDRQLIEEIGGPQYGYNVRNEIQLETKDDMKKRGLSSPDIADALALTFAYPVIPNRMAGGQHDNAQPTVPDYNPIDNALTEAA